MKMTLTRKSTSLVYPLHIRNRTNLAVFSLDRCVDTAFSILVESVDRWNSPDTSTRRSRGERSIGWNRSKIGKIASRVNGSNVLHRLLILTAATITVEIFTIHLAGFWNHLYKQFVLSRFIGIHRLKL